MVWDTINHLLLRPAPSFEPAYPKDGGTVRERSQFLTKLLSKAYEARTFWKNREVICLRASTLGIVAIVIAAVGYWKTQVLAPWIIVVTGMCGCLAFGIFHERAADAKRESFLKFLTSLKRGLRFVVDISYKSRLGNNQSLKSY